MANSKISALTAATLPLAGTEVLPIVQSSATVKVATNDLTVKNVRSNATTGILQIAGPSAGTTRTMTTPDANFTVARTDAANSFTDDQTLSTGNLVQGTAAKGINFTANTPAAGMTSQLLNWYEEGTFNATLTTSGTDFTSVTYSNQSCRYVRTGTLVHIQGRVTTTAVTFGSASGTVALAGLPFTPATSSAGANGRSALNIAFTGGWGTNAPITGMLLNTTSKILLYTRTTANGVSVATNAASGNDVSATSNDIIFSLQYVCS